MRRHALVFINRHSRQGEEQAQRALGLLRQAGFVLDACPAETKQSAPEFLRAHAAGADLVVIGGGDGTINKAAEALLELDLPVGILPMGTGNDLARTLGLPLDLARAVAVIRTGHTERIDVGCVNGRHFLNAATVGLSVEAGRSLDGPLKKRLGPLAYVRTLADALRRNRSFVAEIAHESGTTRRRSIQITVGNGRHHGAGMTVSEAAAIDDHRLDVYSLDPQPWWWLLTHLPELRRGGSSTTGGIWRGQVRRLALRTRPSLPVSTDGDVTTRTPAEFGILPAALEVFTPRDASG